MPCIVTTIHDPGALAETCHRFQAPRPDYGSELVDRRQVFGCLVRLPGLHAPVVVNVLTGLVTYDQRDNGFGRYSRIMRFIHRTYHAQAQRRRGQPVCRAG